ARLSCPLRDSVWSLMREIIVLGAGAIGSLYGALLAPRYPVVLVARSDHANRINDRGLLLSGLASRAVRVQAATKLNSIGPDTLIILTTKVGDTQSATETVSHLVRPDTVLLCLQNGLDGDQIAKAVVAGRCLVLRGITNCGAIFREPGAIEWKAV